MTVSECVGIEHPQRRTAHPGPGIAGELARPEEDKHRCPERKKDLHKPRPEQHHLGAVMRVVHKNPAEMLRLRQPIMIKGDARGKQVAQRRHSAAPAPPDRRERLLLHDRPGLFGNSHVHREHRHRHQHLHQQRVLFPHLGRASLKVAVATAHERRLVHCRSFLVRGANHQTRHHQQEQR